MPGDKPATLGEALTDYAADLKAHNRDEGNATRVRPRLSAALLAKPVELLRDLDLRRWRNGLVESGMNPATVSRTARALHAALNLAAKADPRVAANREAWADSLGGLPGNLPREYVVSDDKVLELIEAAYALDAAFGLLIEVAAQTGARMSQLARIKVADFHDGEDPTLGIPPSRKGHRRKKPKQVVVPITKPLAVKLQGTVAQRDA